MLVRFFVVKPLFWDFDGYESGVTKCKLGKLDISVDAFSRCNFMQHYQQPVCI